jgi:branched-chain amino acid transport system ATP-binding protein
VAFLGVNNLHSFYGDSHILFGLTMNVEKGSLVCLLGRNGAGKSTTVRSIMGLTPRRHGSIIFKNQDVIGMAPYQIARLGISYVPEEREIFPSLTVRENLEIGARILLKKAEVNYRWTIEDIWEHFPILNNLRNRKGGYLSGGEQQMLTIARSLMTCPDLILLDEPCEGLAPVLIKDLSESISKIRESGCTILMAEQNVKFAMSISDYGYIIDKGVTKDEGPISELRSNKDIQKYLVAGKVLDI